MNNDKSIVVKNVTKVYQNGQKGFSALKTTCLEIQKGEMVAVVGKSGSGKSTLLNILGGIDQPSTGSVMINGQEMAGMNESRLSGVRGENIGFVFQFFQLMPTLTILENVLMPMDFVKKFPASERKQRAKTLLEKVGLNGQEHKFPSAMSGGEQQRVAIARALSNDPPIILADEPTGNLDSRTSDDVFQLLNSLCEEGKTVLMVTHNDELAKRCARIIRISDGEIVEDTWNRRRRIQNL